MERLPVKRQGEAPVWVGPGGKQETTTNNFKKGTYWVLVQEGQFGHQAAGVIAMVNLKK